MDNTAAAFFKIKYLFRCSGYNVTFLVVYYKVQRFYFFNTFIFFPKSLLNKLPLSIHRRVHNHILWFVNSISFLTLFYYNITV